MSTSSYRKLLNDVAHQILQNLSTEEREHFLEDLQRVLQQRPIPLEKRYNVMEFQGIAKDFWKGVDIKQFIEEERNSWDG